MNCNAINCKELTFLKKGSNAEAFYPPTADIPQCKKLQILIVYFQEDSCFVNHVKEMFTKANKGLHVLRSLCKEGYSQLEIDNLFKAIVLPNLVHGLSVCGASKAEL